MWAGISGVHVNIANNNIYHKIEAVEGGDECTFTEHVSDIVLPFFTYTSCEPHMVAAAAATNETEPSLHNFTVHNPVTAIAQTLENACIFTNRIQMGIQG